MSVPFHCLGVSKKQNCRLWGSERPQEVNEVLKGAQSFKVLCAISEIVIIRPYFVEDGSITGEINKIMLRYVFIPKLADLSLIHI